MSDSYFSSKHFLYIHFLLAIATVMLWTSSTQTSVGYNNADWGFYPWEPLCLSVGLFCTHGIRTKKQEKKRIVDVSLMCHWCKKACPNCKDLSGPYSKGCFLLLSPHTQPTHQTHTSKVRMGFLCMAEDKGSRPEISNVISFTTLSHLHLELWEPQLSVFYEIMNIYWYLKM